jgi:N-acetylglucosamine malate deacetylase 1
VKETARHLVAAAMRLTLQAGARPLVLDPRPAVIVAPHADDETLGCGALLAARAARGFPTTVVFVTDSAAESWSAGGDRPARAVRRRAEAEAALTELGLDPATAVFLNALDGELDRLGAATRAALEDRLAQVLSASRAHAVFTPCQEDGSSEHLAATAMVRAAVQRVRPAPRLWEYPVWAWWNALRLRRRLQAPRQVRALDARPWRAAKRRALACHASQLGRSEGEGRLPAVLADLVNAPVEFFFPGHPQPS